MFDAILQSLASLRSQQLTLQQRNQKEIDPLGQLHTTFSGAPPNLDLQKFSNGRDLDVRVERRTAWLYLLWPKGRVFGWRTWIHEFTHFLEKETEIK